MADSELHIEKVAAPDAEPDAWLMVLHGVFGWGRNWAMIADPLVQQRPEWGVALVDLRGHGRSTGLPGANTLETAASDVLTTIAALDGPVRALLGHSFGGKVALKLAEIAGSSRSMPDQLWIVDSNPGPKPDGGNAWPTLQLLQQMPETFDTRRQAVDQLVRQGISEPVAQWLASNLERHDDGRYRWRIELEVIESLLRDYYRQDLWPIIDQPPADTTLHMVKASESPMLDQEAVRRIEAARGDGQNIHLHHVSGGHWVNAQNPRAMVDLLVRHL